MLAAGLGEGFAGGIARQRYTAAPNTSNPGSKTRQQQQQQQQLVIHACRSGGSLKFFQASTRPRGTKGKPDPNIKVLSGDRSSANHLDLHKQPFTEQQQQQQLSLPCPCGCHDPPADTLLNCVSASLIPLLIKAARSRVDSPHPHTKLLIHQLTHFMAPSTPLPLAPHSLANLLTDLLTNSKTHSITLLLSTHLPPPSRLTSNADDSVVEASDQLHHLHLHHHRVTQRQWTNPQLAGPAEARLHLPAGTAEHTARHGTGHNRQAVDHQTNANTRAAHTQTPNCGAAAASKAARRPHYLP